MLLAALFEMGYTEVEDHIGSPQPLVGYQGDFRTADGIGHTRKASEAMKADIIIRRKQVGSSSNDIGFTRNADGTYSAIISDFDSTRHNAGWLKSVKQEYSKQFVFANAKKAGYKLVVTKPVERNGKKVTQYKYAIA